MMERIKTRHRTKIREILSDALYNNNRSYRQKLRHQLKKIKSDILKEKGLDDKYKKKIQNMIEEHDKYIIKLMRGII